jgi:hypothetical protein
MADREALDLFLGDMAGHQAQFVGETTPSANQSMAAALFEQMDQKRADVAGRLVSAPAAADPAPADERPSRVEAAKRGFEFKDESQLPDEKPIADVWSQRDVQRYEKVQRRVALLLSKDESGPLGAPSWRARVMAIMALKYAKPELRVTAGAQLAALVEESNATFGAWYAERPKRIQVG